MMSALRRLRPPAVQAGGTRRARQTGETNTYEDGRAEPPVHAVGATEADAGEGETHRADGHVRERPPGRRVSLLRRLSASEVYGLIGLLILVAAVSGLVGGWEQDLLFLIGVSSIVAITVSVYRYRPSHLWMWQLIVAALVLFLAGGVARTELNTLGNTTASRSLVPDVLTLPGYALLTVALLGFSQVRLRGQHRYSSTILDGIITALALASLAWVFAIQPTLAGHHTPAAVQAIYVIYPSFSIFLVVIMLRIAFNSEHEHAPSFWFLVVAMAAVFVGDTLYALADVNLISVPTRLLDLPYGIAYLTAGAGALHPSMRKLTEPGVPRRTSTSRGRAALVGIALVIPAILTLQHRAETTGGRIALFVVIIALTGAAVLRLVQALYTVATSEAKLTYQATHDSLTGLPNRQLMQQHLHQLLEREPADETHVALLFLDLDRFKLINDTLGHHHGDQLLIEVAERLRANVRPTDLVTRIGGDEFMIVLEHVVSVSQALDLAHRLRSALQAPFTVNDNEFFVSASIGLAFATGDDPHATAEVLVSDADTAMFQAKDAGRDAIAVFEEAMRTRVSERVELEHDLRSAVALHQLHLVYQPIVRLPRGPIEGVEALARWVHPTQGVIPPPKFIPLAEETGLIKEIGAWVLDEALRQLAAWRRQSEVMEGLYVSVNLSGVQLHDSGIVNLVADMLASYELDGPSLCLELTESVIMDDPVATASILEELRTLGVRLAIDDFGTEYSSLAYLQRFPVTMLKIDKSFVDSLVEADTAEASLVAAIVAMAKALGITTVAEGVETPVQARRLIKLGCHSVQGYLYSRPVQADRLPEVVGSLWTRELQPMVLRR